MLDAAVEVEDEGACAGWRDEDVSVVDGNRSPEFSGIGLVGNGNDGGGRAGQRRQGQRSGRCV